MAKTIVTQEGNLVNYAHIITVSVEISDEGDVYGLIATDIASSIHILGIYSSKNTAVSAQKKLTDWLDSEVLGVYSVAENGGERYGE